MVTHQRTTGLALLIISLMIFSFLGACVPGGGGSKGKIVDEDFRTGTKGIELVYLKNFPPSQIQEGYTSKAILEVKNRGAFDIANGLVTLYSVDKNIEIIPTYQTYDLEGKDGFFEGGTKHIEFTITPTSRGDGKSSIFSRGCYKYESIALGELCLDPGVTSPVSSEKVCEMKDVTFSGGQGGPVSVSKVSVVPLINDGRFRLKLNVSVRNSGQGKIIKDNLYEDPCKYSSADLDEDYNYVKASVKIPGHAVNCDQKTFSFGKRDSGHIVCESSTMVAQSAQMIPIQVVLEYGYITKDIAAKVEIMPR